MPCCDGYNPDNKHKLRQEISESAITSKRSLNGQTIEKICSNRARDWRWRIKERFQADTANAWKG